MLCTFVTKAISVEATLGKKASEKAVGKLVIKILEENQKLVGMNRKQTKKV